jgi:hypothetical protein
MPEFEVLHSNINKNGIFNNITDKGILNFYVTIIKYINF